jgi:hypothetical protein
MRSRPSLATLSDRARRPGAYDRAIRYVAPMMIRRYATPYHWERFLEALEMCGYRDDGDLYQGGPNTLARFVSVSGDRGVSEVFCSWLMVESAGWRRTRESRQARSTIAVDRWASVDRDGCGPVLVRNLVSRDSRAKFVHRAISARAPGEVANLAWERAERHRIQGLLARHGDALASIRQVLRHRS